MKSQDEGFTTKLFRVKNIRTGVKYAICRIRSFGEIAKIRHMSHTVGKELSISLSYKICPINHNIIVPMILLFR